MASTSPGYGITIRVEGSPDSNPVALATTVITAAGATITALDVVESLLEKVVIDITCDTVDADHAEEITSAISLNPELTVRKVSDRTFLLHLGGKIEVASKVPLKTRDDLSRASPDSARGRPRRSTGACPRPSPRRPPARSASPPSGSRPECSCTAT